jgi:hypothetical protein
MSNLLNALSKPHKSLISIFLIGIMFASSTIALAADSKKVLPSYVFSPAENPLMQVKTALSKAKTENKYALIVLGAQWCHDSVTLAERFSNEQMQSVLSDTFVTQFIDVGYLEDRRDITTLVGYPHYFATPTVLIVNPTSNEIMNIDSLKVWQSADSVELQEYVERFSSFNTNEADMKLAQRNDSKALASFEIQQSERLQQGYEILGPLLAVSDSEMSSSMSGDERERFLKLWREVKQFRMTIQATIHELRSANLVKAELQKKLVEATPEAQSWEAISEQH